MLAQYATVHLYIRTHEALQPFDSLSICLIYSSAKSPTWERTVFCIDIAEPSGLMGTTSTWRAQWNCCGLQGVTSTRWRMVWWVILLL